ncbi:MAG: hypothetical protein ALECFALPRED_008991 [Alectoria fallacina]|uniref:Uncharacterized protein n=1 Tax=Alectoria fallacina TaxID=1903189 RepID=A0A8H3J5D2_9LECA|nr:MAG: hypothetical protein ALECFALPRED_008991 [Alectoria fallacina]
MIKAPVVRLSFGCSYQQILVTYLQMPSPSHSLRFHQQTNQQLLTFHPNFIYNQQAETTSAPTMNPTTSPNVSPAPTIRPTQQSCVFLQPRIENQMAKFNTVHIERDPSTTPTELSKPATHHTTRRKQAPPS